MSVIADWTAAKALRFGRSEMTLRHTLAERPMFDDAGLEEVLDRYPRDKLGVFTMGHDPVDWKSWRRGEAGELSGAQLLEAAKTGRIWLNLRGVNHHLPAYAALGDEIFADFEGQAPALRTFKRDVGLLISSPRAQVFYHLDVAMVTLWGVRGEKTLYVYPPHAPFVDEEQLEQIVLRAAPEQLAFDPQWDERATVMPLKPGQMASWRQNAPHRVVNGPMLNVSLSVEHMTPQALMRANVIYANALLRRNAGMAPSVQAGFGPTALAKFGLARAAKAVRRRQGATAPSVSFRLGDRRGGDRVAGWDCA